MNDQAQSRNPSSPTSIATNIIINKVCFIPPKPYRFVGSVNHGKEKMQA
ncbi:MAG: hypothetical protein VCA18_04175 [Opitutales bacterium]